MSVARAKAMAPRLDYVLLGAVLCLLGLGLVMVLSASGIMAEQAMGSKYHFFVRQTGFAVLGMGVLAVAAVFPRDGLFKLTYLWLTLALGLLALTLAGPLSHSAGGASRWLRLGPVSLQPLEAAKLALVVYLAYFFGAKQSLVDRFSVGFAVPLAVTGVLGAMLLAQPDFGGAVLLLLLFGLMSFVGGGSLLHLGGAGLLGAAGAAYLVATAPYRVRRLTAFVDPFADAGDTGYQLVQSLYALGSGGIFGVGLGESRQKLLFLPEAHNDFLMAVVGEELGFVGVSAIFVLVGLVLWRGLAIAFAQQELRDRLLAFGLTWVLGLGFLLNLAVVLGAAPPKGVPMPFMSYGGSNLVASLACVGLLLNLSRGERP